jgi:hypothetical protein
MHTIAKSHSFWEVESGFASTEKQDLDPHQGEKLDPDPHHCDADPQH